MTSRLLEAPELAGYRDLWSALPAAAASALGMAHAERGGAHCVAAGGALADHRLLNHALGLPADGPVSQDVLADVEGFFAARGRRAPLGLPRGAPAEAQLQRLGYRAAYAWAKFVRDAAPVAGPATCELAVRPVAPADAWRVGELVAAGFALPDLLAPWFATVVGRPGWHCLGAYDGPELVATGSLYVHGDSGWVTWGATDAAHRGRGAQKALLAARIALAASLGLRRLVTETGEREPGRPDASYRNILAAGFAIAYRRTFWQRPGPA